ncbi:MAG: class I SAM-dependent methyltransferase [Calditrichaceae bacterium]|nr:class I SAM-dependent methyltransferase [Calditrichaceae bacterium]MBN2710345.1 class I SAM-dependent methyltransferase [Calditrichaceae bacterium]RQV95095.1 MAG: class I SAM-dependent methyltransferase [Calditrichota bacterium]
MKCKICESTAELLFSAKVLGKYDVEYFQCKECGFVQTEDPFWLEEAYKNPINLADTGLVNRNIFLAEKTSALLYKYFNLAGKYLDYAGGYGLFTRLMRDIGFDFYWSDPFTVNIFARYFEFNEQSEQIELITSFESFEHFADPMEQIAKMLEISPNIFFSTTLIPIPYPAPDKWWYYGFEHGQHIAFYSPKTLYKIADIFGLNIYTNNSFLHLFTEKPLNQKQFLKTLKTSNQIINKVKKQKLSSKTESDSEMIKQIQLETNQ